MLNITFPTSKDIYLEVNGKKLAVVESYKAKSTCNSQYIEAFGQSEPIGTVAGKIQHTIELSRVYACEENQKPNYCSSIHSLSQIVKIPQEKNTFKNVMGRRGCP